MRTLSPAVKALCCSLLTFHMLLLSGCAPAAKVTVSRAFNPAPDQNIVFVLPFANSLVPEAFSETVFNDFIDNLNKDRRKGYITWFYIIKENPANVEPAWREKQVYVTGEIWSYIENAGCCSTELRVKARLRLFEPEQKDPTLEIFIPLEGFFEHDRSPLAVERQRLAQRLASEMSDAVIKALAKRRMP